jgi:5,5'-dehydrodivanillate O-demethylase
MHYSYYCIPRAPGEPARADIPVYEIPYIKENGKLINDNVLGQDMLSWLTQGTISDRSTERLGWSDKGVILFRSIMFEQMEKVARGEDPLGVVRDSEKNRMLVVPREHKAFYTPTGEMVIEHQTNDPLDVVRSKAIFGHAPKS